MTLTYDFDDRDFEYEVDSSDLETYFDEQPIEVIVEAAEEGFSNMSEQERSEIITDILNDGDIHLLKKHQEGTNVKYSIDWEKAYEEDKSWVMEFVDVDSFKDDIKDYFYRDAAEAYDDAESYRRDPYGYNGVNERDFY